MGPNETTAEGARAPFPETAWSRILQAQDGSRSLNDLLAAYWKPVYGYLRSLGRPVEEAKDLTQEFLVRMLERDFLRDLSPEKGSFRGFLKTALKRFVIDEDRTRGRQKRGGGGSPLSLDFAGAEELLQDHVTATPDAAFDREWMQSLIATASNRLRAELLKQGRNARWEVFRTYDLEAADCSYAELGRRLRLTDAEVRHHLSHARDQFRRILVGCMSEYVTSEEELRQELRELFGE